MDSVMSEDQQSGRVLARRYALGPRLGRGGMGVVWRAHDQVLERDVAIKEIELPPALGGSDRDAVRRRVMREARAAAALNFPGAVTVFDVIEENGCPFIVMELVDGPTLDEVVAHEGPLSPERAAQIGLDILAALEVAHRNGIVHRDVKPANVMLPAGGRAKLSDFGIASVKDDPKITNSGIVLGSPSYMAPEQARAARSGPSSDLYSLGATLYFAVEGAPPFDRGRPIATLAAVVGDEPRPPIRAGQLTSILSALLAKAPERRPSSGKLRVQLEALAGRRVRDPGVSTATFTPTLPLPPDGGDDRHPSRPFSGTASGPAAGTRPGASRSSFPPAGQERPLSRPSSGQRWDLSRPRPARKSRAPWLVGLLLVVAAVAAGALWLGRGDPGAAVGNGAGSRAAQADANPGTQEGGADSGKVGDSSPAAAGQETIQPSASSSAQSTEEPAAPAGWKPYSDGESNYTIAYPPGWTVTSHAAGTDFSDPASGTYLRVAHTSTPGPSALGAWQSLSEDFAARHSGYETIRLEPTTFEGSDNAALWEYRYSEGGAELHAVDLGFVIDDDGYALNYQTHQEDWAAGQSTFEDFKASFRPTG